MADRKVPAFALDWGHLGGPSRVSRVSIPFLPMLRSLLLIFVCWFICRQMGQEQFCGKLAFLSDRQSLKSILYGDWLWRHWVPQTFIHLWSWKQKNHIHQMNVCVFSYRKDDFKSLIMASITQSRSYRFMDILFLGI